MAMLNDKVRALIDGNNFLNVATINPDGAPQSSIVWCTRDGDDVLFSVTRERRKTRNMRRDPRVSLTVYNMEDPYEYAEIRGTASLSEQDGRALIDELSNEYIGRNFWPDPQGTVRVIVRVTPEKVLGTAA